MNIKEHVIPALLTLVVVIVAMSIYDNWVKDALKKKK